MSLKEAGENSNQNCAVLFEEVARGTGLYSIHGEGLVTGQLVRDLENRIRRLVTKRYVGRSLRISMESADICAPCEC